LSSNRSGLDADATAAKPTASHTSIPAKAENALEQVRAAVDHETGLAPVLADPTDGLKNWPAPLSKKNACM
jgi:hypothetical protein